MPIYEYTCPSCDTLFEKITSSHDADTAICPQCNKEAKRIVSHSAFHLKGGGWYTTEYGSKSKSDSHSDTTKPTATESSSKTSEASGE